MRLGLIGGESHSREEVKDMLLHLEDEYRKAAISEKNYAELKAKYSNMLKKFEKADKKISRDVDEKDVRMKKEEEKDVKMFLESLEDQYEKGEINKNDYENIKNVNMNRLKEIKGGLEEEDRNNDEIEIQVRKKEKEGVFKKLFGRLKKKKREEDKVEVDVEEEEYLEPVIEDIPGKEEVQLEVKKRQSHNIFKRIENDDEKKDDFAKEVEDMPEEKEDKQEAEELPEEKVEETEAQAVESAEEPAEQKEEKPKKKGLLNSLFKKKKPEEQVKEEAPKEEAKETQKEETKEEKLEPGEIEEVTPEVIEKLASQMAESSGTTVEPEEAPEEEAKTELPESGLSIEIEKLKVMMDSFREAKKATDDTIQNISENIGEIRSMVMQADANYKTSMANMERLEDEVSDTKPKEISKKFTEIKESMEKDRLEVEKLQRKSDTTAEKVNEIYEMLKSIGGIENLMNLNNDIQTKLKDINEAIKYIQRIGTKTEKIFIDLSKGLEDLVLLKAKQEDFDESLKNSLTAIDSFSVKLKDYVSKSDMESFREDNILIKRQIEDIKKVLPVADLKLPEDIVKLRKGKEDVEMFLNSLESQAREGKIGKLEYEEMKRVNSKKLDEIEKSLEREWKELGMVINPGGEEEKATSSDAQTEPEKRTKKSRRKKASKKISKSEEDSKKKILKELKLGG